MTNPVITPAGDPAEPQTPAVADTTTAASGSASRTLSLPQPLAWFVRRWKGNPLFSTGFALVVMVVVQSIVLAYQAPDLATWLTKLPQNWINILRNNASIGIISLGMTLVIITGGIDLAVGSTLVAVGAIVMLMIDTGSAGILTSIGITGPVAYAIAILVGAAAGFLLGELTGLLVTKGKLPPFIATLGTMAILRSVTQYLMTGRTPRVPVEFTQIANLTIGGQYLMQIIYWLVLAVIVWFISKKTVFGRQVIAVGSNPRAALLSGVNVQAVKRRVYVLLGVLVSFAAVLQVARIGSMDYANAGSGYEMDAISAVVVGGTSMAGGRGTIIGTVFGALIIGVMNNLLNIMGVPPLLREAFKGAIVIGAVLLQKNEG
ncbi:MAG: ABC transporter permease [Propionibacteriaceae bacterium]|nr:ABC transporter permease [Propionibacteriaceae bacterium]